MIAKRKGGGDGDPLPERIKRSYFTGPETQDQLGVSYDTLRRLRIDGHFEENKDWIKHGRKIYFRKSSVDRYMKRIAE